jgi:hypothetical protein
MGDRIGCSRGLVSRRCRLGWALGTDRCMGKGGDHETHGSALRGCLDGGFNPFRLHRRPRRGVARRRISSPRMGRSRRLLSSGILCSQRVFSSGMVLSSDPLTNQDVDPHHVGLLPVRRSVDLKSQTGRRMERGDPNSSDARQRTEALEDVQFFNSADLVLVSILDQGGWVKGKGWAAGGGGAVAWRCDVRTQDALRLAARAAWHVGHSARPGHRRFSSLLVSLLGLVRSHRVRPSTGSRRTPCGHPSGKRRRRLDGPLPLC